MNTTTEKPDVCTDDELQEYLQYLDELRESGVTNMFGASQWLEDAFDIQRSTAKPVLLYWMATFSERHPR
jgi:hypothetical protein